MINRIRTDRQYNQVMELIETFLKKATEQGGFHTLNKKDADELQRLSLLAEEYEDNILKVMPIPLTIKAMVQQSVAELEKGTRCFVLKSRS